MCCYETCLGSSPAMLLQGLEVEAVAAEIAEATMPTVQRVAALEAEIRCIGAPTSNS